MKNLYLFIFSLFVSLTGFAQNGDGFNYQAIVRDITGNVNANVSVNMEISILQGSVDGTVVFTEIHAVTTNAFGLVNLSIGSQNPSSFALIDWANSPYFIRTSINGVEFGTSQLMSVPYALHTKTAENYNETDPEFSVSIAKGITAADITRWNNSADGSVLKGVGGDTKIQVGEDSGENEIRFDINGTERWVMDRARLEPKNTGMSVFIGQSAGLNDDLSSNENIFIGYEAGKSNTSGNRNTAHGSRALHSNKTGNYNVAYGVESLYSNTKGHYNTATGSMAMYYNVIGDYNTANGAMSLLFNTTGDKNTALGFGANAFNKAGDRNVALGFKAGRGASLHSKSGNVFLGYKAGYYETGDNKLYIDNSNTDAPLIYGDFAADLLRVNGELEVSGSIKIVDGSQGAGKVLTSDANGLASWNNSAENYNETDPLFSASPLINITQSDIDNWTSKLDEFTEADPVFLTSIAKGITAADTTRWNNSANGTVFRADQATYSDTAQYAELANAAISAATADQATHSDTAQYAELANAAISAATADQATYSDTAQYAELANAAISAATADQATHSDTAQYAELAKAAISAATADQATYSDTAQYAELANAAISAATADQATYSDTAQYAELAKAAISAATADQATYSDTAQYAELANAAISAATADQATHSDT
ncbi:MAG: hypothetical protein GY834_07320, partial [Bacteroidetes bacterium]|nr:hypothetical protein [Bacteroidota bacterium]